MTADLCSRVFFAVCVSGTVENAKQEVGGEGVSDYDKEHQEER